MDYSTGVDMIAVCSADGSFQPLRFRFDDGTETQRVRVLEILSCKEVRYVNVEAYEYVCRALVGDQEQVLRIRYGIRAHRWSLFQSEFH